MDKSKFLKVKCPRCSKMKITFGKASMRIKCDNCGKQLTRTTGGKTKIQAQVAEVLK